MWYLIVSIPDLCTLTYFGYRFFFISVYAVLFRKKRLSQETENESVKHIGVEYVNKEAKNLASKDLTVKSARGAQWLSGRVLDSRPRGRGFKPHRRHCIVVLEQDTFILV